MAVLNPAFLWALAAVSVPLWLHLSRRRQYQDLPIGTLRFLQEVLKERRKRSRFEEIPLLLLRLLAVALLAVVFIRPYVQSDEKAAESPAETVVLLDASGSVTPTMREEGLALAKKAAAKVAEGSKLTLAQFSDDVQSLTDLDKWSPLAGAPTDLIRAMGWALDRLGGAGTSRAGKIVLLAHVAAGDLPPTPPRVWPPGVTLEIIPLAPPSPANAAVRKVTLLTPYVTGQMEIEAEVQLPAGTDRTVTLQAEGITDRQMLPEGADRVIFRINPPRDEVRGTISTASGDAWPTDDVRPFAVRWVEPRRVLLVDGHPGSTPFEGQAYFAEKALTASGAVHGKTPFQAEIVFGLSGRQGQMDLNGVAAVALCGLPELSAADGRLLAQYVSTGGGLLVTLDARWTPSASAVLESQGLLPRSVRLAAGESVPVGTQAAAERADEPRPIGVWDRNHAVLSAFDGKEGGDIRDMEWRDEFDIPLDDGWKVLATLDGGRPLLLEKPATDKAGRVLVLAHPLTREWTDLPRDPLFVPLVKSLFAWVSKAESASPEVPPHQPGVHEARPPGLYTDINGTTEIVAAAPGESAVRTSTPASLRTAFGVSEVSVQTVKPRDDPALAAATVPWRYELWPWAAATLLVLLMAENLLATRRFAAAPPS